MASKADDPRLGTIIQDKLPDTAQLAGKTVVVVIGFPYDEGVRRNGGRPGARDGPAEFRRWIQKLGPTTNPRERTSSVAEHVVIYDYGNIDPGLSLEQAHVVLQDTVYKQVAKGHIPFVIGGGNDQSYHNWWGARRAVEQLDTVNIDAHFDVRPLIDNTVAHSGSPFRQMLESDLWNAKHNFLEFAAQSDQCSVQHADYLHDKGASIAWYRDIRKSPSAVDCFIQSLQRFNSDQGPSKLFMSFDLDSVRGSDAPGVSCPGTIGLSSDDALDICEVAGRDFDVAVFDLSEFNPTIEAYRTGRLVAFMFYAFCRGLAQKRASQQQ